MNYETPVMDVILFNGLDVITTSEITGGGLGGGDLGDGGGADVNSGSRTVDF